MTKERWFDDLNKKISQGIKIDEPLYVHTMTKMGGRADLFVTPTTEEETNVCRSLCTSTSNSFIIARKRFQYGRKGWRCTRDCPELIQIEPD